MELQVQSNLPVIILCILVISLCVLGYFEYKKMMIRFESIEKKLSDLSEKKDDLSSPDLTLEEKQQMIMRQQQMQQQQMIMRQQQMQQQHIQQNQMQQNNKINIDMDLPKEQNVEVLEKVNVNKEINGLTDNKDEEILDDNKSSNADYSDDDSRSSDYSDSYSERSDDYSDNDDDNHDNDNDDNDDNDNHNDDDNDDDDNDNDNDDNDKENIENIVDITDEFKDKYIGDNEIKLATEVSNDKKTVLNDMSVNQLKDECKVLNLPVSGNKTKLIERIETFKKIE